MKVVKNVFINVFRMMSSNVIILIAGLLNTLVIPIVLSKSDYGYFRTFYLYLNYVAFLHLGFLDGFLLRNAGASEMFLNKNKQKYKSLVQFITIFEFVISFVFIFITFIAPLEYRVKIILVFLGIYNFYFNLSTYYQFMSRVTLNFKRVTTINAIQYFIIIVLILISWFFDFLGYKVNYLYYFIMMVLAAAVSYYIYVYKYRDFTFGKISSIKNYFFDIKNTFYTGFSSMLGFQSYNILLNMDNLFTSLLFRSSVYADYSLAYSMVTIVISIITAPSGLVLPYIKRIKNRSFALNLHEIITRYLLMIVFLMITGYYLIVIIVGKYLPQYSGSLDYFKIVFAMSSITCVINIVIFNFYSYLNITSKYLKINMVNILFTFIIYLVSIFIYKSPLILAYLSIVSMLIWYLSLESYLFHHYKTRFMKNYLYSIIMIILFVILNQFLNNLEAFICYLIFYFIVTSLFYYKNIGKLMKIIKRRKGKNLIH